MTLEYVQHHCDAVQIRWMCQCGGEYRHIAQAFKTIPVPPILQGRGGYTNVVYPHQCTKCGSISDNVRPFPRLVAKDSNTPVV